MKERPKVGDRVEFWMYGMARIGKVVYVVSETGVHFLIDVPTGRYRYRRIPLSAIIRILPPEIMVA